MVGAIQQMVHIIARLHKRLLATASDPEASLMKAKVDFPPILNFTYTSLRFGWFLFIVPVLPFPLGVACQICFQRTYRMSPWCCCDGLVHEGMPQILSWNELLGSQGAPTARVQAVLSSYNIRDLARFPSS